MDFYWTEVPFWHSEQGRPVSYENLSFSGDLMGLANFIHRQDPCRNLVSLRSISIVHARMTLAMGIFAGWL